MKLIDADTVIEQIAQAQASLSNCSDAMWEINRNYFKGLSWVHRIILDAPEVDPVKHGKWISDGLGDGERICSVCKRYALYTHRDRYDQYLTKSCPNCGAKMDLESEGTDE